MTTIQEETVARITEIQQRQDNARLPEIAKQSPYLTALSQAFSTSGPLMYAFPADHSAIESYIGSQVLSRPNITFADWNVTTKGAPYVDLDGTTEALYVADAAWQEATSNNLFVWHWVYPTSVGATITIASKYDTNGNNRSWSLRLNPAGPNFRFVANQLGTAAADVVVDSSVTVAANNWYFVAAFFQPNVQLRIWTAPVTAISPTGTSNVVGVPASLFNGTAPLAIGTDFNAAPTLLNPWNGYISVGGARLRILATLVEAFTRRIFRQTRWFYQ